jgi:hypothetical protein
MEKISWTDRVRNEEVLHRVKEERNIVLTIKTRKANWIGHILRRNCLLKHMTEGKLEGRIEMTGRRGRSKQRWRSWLRHCATSRKVAGSIPDGVIGIFRLHNPSGRIMALGSTQPLTEMSTRNISWGVKAFCE